MQFFSTLGYSAALALLAPIAVASPVANATATVVSRAAAGVDMCGDSTFFGETSGGSPHWLHCLQIRNQISADASWTMNLGQWRDIYAWGDCKFVVKTDHIGGASLGGQDVKDIIWDAINRFRNEDRIGARGTAKCHNALQFGSIDLDWYIWHT